MKKFLTILSYLGVLACFAKGQTKSGNENEERAKIQVVYPDAENNDTLLLMYFNNTIDNKPYQSGKYVELKSIQNTNGKFSFNFPVNNATGYFFIAKLIKESDPIKKEMPTLRFYQLTALLYPEKGDDIMMTITDKQNISNGPHRCIFAGKGADKYSVRDSVTFVIGENIKGTEIFDKDNRYLSSNSSQTVLELRLAYLDLRRHSLSDDAYNVLKADVVFRNVGLEGTVEYYFKRKLDGLATAESYLLRNNFVTSYPQLRKTGNYGISDVGLAKSSQYTDYMLTQALCDQMVREQTTDSIYPNLKKDFKGSVRDKILTSYFLNPNYPKNYKYLDDALRTVKSSQCLKVLQELKKGIGSIDGYNFSLVDSNGKPVSKKDFEGKVIFIDFWFTGCGACSSFYTGSLSKVEERFRNNKDVVFLSISIDRNQKQWIKSIDSKKYTSNDAINLNTAGKGTDHPIIGNFNITEYPSAFLLDKQGKIISNNQVNLFNETSLSELIEGAVKM